MDRNGYDAPLESREDVKRQIKALQSKLDVLAKPSVYGYVRVSTRSQSVNGNSLEGQRLLLMQIRHSKFGGAFNSPHKLRSSFAMGGYGATKDILVLQERMVHESLVTTNIYAKAASVSSKETRNWR